MQRCASAPSPLIRRAALNKDSTKIGDVLYDADEVSPGSEVAKEHFALVAQQPQAASGQIDAVLQREGLSIPAGSGNRQLDSGTILDRNGG